MQRRCFLTAPAIALIPTSAAADPGTSPIYMTGDGLPQEPVDYTASLGRVAGALMPDDYSRGGVIEQIESKMAAKLGKEAAVWLPTGTLANHLAVRLLSGDRRRVLVQAESHLFRDSGDCAQTLSGLHLVPLAPGKATFSLQDVENAWTDSLSGRVEVPIGAVQIETPVRRQSGEQFDFHEFERISKWAREHKAGLHLDGARLFIESAYTKRPVQQYAALADTVYVSMWKYFNAASGAVLAGPRRWLDNLYHTRRMFGGGLPHSWPIAAPALEHIDTFEKTFAEAVQISEAVIQVLSVDSNFELKRIPNGTNIFRLRPTSVNPPVYQGRLQQAGIITRAPTQDWFSLQVNATWTRATAEEIIARFRRALG